MLPLYHFVPLLHRVVAEHGCLKYVSIDIGLLCYCTCHAVAATTDMRRLTTGIRSEKYVVKRFRRCAKVIV
jgi:hypothetical protein